MRRPCSRSIATVECGWLVGRSSRHSISPLSASILTTLPLGVALDGDVELPVEVGRAGGGRVAGVGLPQDLAVVERHRRDHAVVGADVEAPVRDRRRPVAAAVVVADRGRPVHRSVRRDRLHAAGVVGEHDRPVRRLYRAPLEAEWSPLFAGTSHAVSTLSGIVASMYPVFRRPCRN